MASNDTSSNRGILLFLVATLVVVMLMWRGCWYGTYMTDAQIEAALEAEDELGELHRALNQIDTRIVKGDGSVEKFFPRLIELAKHENAETRTAVAWVMSDAELYEPFNAPLLELVGDESPLVRVQAAAALARRKNDVGRPALLEVLDHIPIRATTGGKVTAMLKKDEPLIVGVRLVRIEKADGTSVDVLTPLPGKVSRTGSAKGDVVEEGDVVTYIQAGDQIIHTALLALMIVGKPEDVTPVRRLVDGSLALGRDATAQAKRTLAHLSK